MVASRDCGLEPVDLFQRERVVREAGKRSSWEGQSKGPHQGVGELGSGCDPDTGSSPVLLEEQREGCWGWRAAQG